MLPRNMLGMSEPSRFGGSPDSSCSVHITGEANLNLAGEAPSGLRPTARHAIKSQQIPREH